MANTRQYTKPIPVRIKPDQLVRIDRLKGELVPREAYVRHLLEKALAVEERTAK